MENRNIKNEIQTMVQDFEEKVNKAFENTKYSNETNQIIEAYRNYLNQGIKNGFIKPDELNLYRFSTVIYDPEFSGYANTGFTISERYFLELKDDNIHKNNVIYHEFTHLHFTPQCNKNLTNLNGFNYYILKKIGHTNFKAGSDYDIASNAVVLMNEFLTQETAERFSEEIDGNKRREKHKFNSKIFTPDINCESNFQTYQDYQELFLAFARTINGFGNLKDAEIYDKFKDMLEEGTIANQIIGTYQEKNKECDLINVFILMGKVKLAHESAMGINKSYSGDKEALTNEVNMMLKYLRENKNLDEFKKYSVKEYKERPHFVFKIGVNSANKSSQEKIDEAKQRVSADLESEKNKSGLFRI